LAVTVVTTFRPIKIVVVYPLSTVLRAVLVTMKVVGIQFVEWIVVGRNTIDVEIGTVLVIKEILVANIVRVVNTFMVR